jgi:hypothetical protein
MNVILSKIKKTVLAAIAFVLTFAKINAQMQKVDTVKIPDIMAALIPSGYMAINIVYGNLNMDTATDALVVIQKRQLNMTPDDSSFDGDRTLLLFIKEKGVYKKVASNGSVALCEECGGMMGDPFQGVEIKNGEFTVYNYGGSAWRWSEEVTFKYNKLDKHWYAKEQVNETFHAADESHTKLRKILTAKQLGKIRFEQFKYFDNIEYKD